MNLGIYLPIKVTKAGKPPFQLIMKVFLKQDEGKLMIHVLDFQHSDKARLMTKPNSRETG